MILYMHAARSLHNVENEKESVQNNAKYNNN